MNKLKTYNRPEIHLVEFVGGSVMYGIGEGSTNIQASRGHRSSDDSGLNIWDDDE